MNKRAATRECVIVDYRMGNLGSIQNMLRKIGVPHCVSRDPEFISKAEKLILPGVGAFGQGMENLREMNLIPALEEAVKGDDKDDIEAKTTALTEAVSGVAQKMYAEAAAAEQAEGGEEAQTESAEAEDVVDAEFEEVKDDKK